VIAAAGLKDRTAALREEAERFAGGLAAVRSMTSPAIERANLRFVGVGGLTAGGEPLAAAVVERFAALGPAAFGQGVGLIFAAAAARQGLGPRETALAIASGDIDLADELPHLAAPAQRAAASMLLAQWTDEAYARIDANRTATRELVDDLGRPARPWLGAQLRAPTADGAIAEARAMVAAGADVVLVRVPRGRELARAVGPGGAERLPREMDPPPTGSQRGLAALRTALDESAAERGAYVSLGTATDGLAAPEQAVVAGFERADVVLADPFDEIAMGIAPERALADHAAAHRLLRRSGAVLVLGPGPLLAGPELTRGEPITASTRVGRSIAAQAVAAAWARASGLPDEQILVQAPFEMPDPPEEAALLLAGILVRRLLHPAGALVIGEPPDVRPGDWSVTMPACLLAGGEVALVVPRADPSAFPGQVGAIRAAVRLARLLSAALPHEDVSGGLVFGSAVEEAASSLVEAARESLGRAAVAGWASLVGSAEAADGGGSAGADLVEARDHAGPLHAGGPQGGRDPR
jgi:hypothetical protein